MLQESSQRVDSLALRTCYFRIVHSVVLRTQVFEDFGGKGSCQLSRGSHTNTQRITCTLEGHLPQGATNIKTHHQIIEDCCIHCQHFPLKQQFVVFGCTHVATLPLGMESYEEFEG
jgi:hypothetical protein